MPPKRKAAAVDTSRESAPLRKSKRIRVYDVTTAEGNALTATPVVKKAQGASKTTKATETIKATKHRQALDEDADSPTSPGPAAASSASVLELPTSTPTKEKATSKPKSRAKGKSKGKSKAVEVLEQEQENAAYLTAPEKRLARYRAAPPAKIRDRMVRCQTQRMFVVGRHPVSVPEGSPPEETFDIAGTTGNIYNVHIKKVPECNCPDGKKNGQCKHILYILMKVLRARDDLVYQAALLSEELVEIFQNAPPTPTLLDRVAVGEGAGEGTDQPGNRKPLDEDDCPICYCPFEEGQSTVWCQAQCGSNLHTDCFKQWAATKGAGSITCVMCRSPWVECADTKGLQEALANASVGSEGYVNIAGQLGISGQRDWSSYGNYHWGSRYYNKKRYRWS